MTKPTVISWHIDRWNTFVLHRAWGKWYGEWEGDCASFAIADRRTAIAQARAEVRRFLAERSSNASASKSA